MRPTYPIKENHKYNPNIPTILDNDPVKASLTINPVIEEIINNTDYIYNKFNDEIKGGGQPNLTTRDINQTVDREAGTWRPAPVNLDDLTNFLFNNSQNVRTGRYARIGDLVIATWRGNTRRTTGDPQRIIFSGLPFIARTAVVVNVEAWSASTHGYSTFPARLYTAGNVITIDNFGMTGAPATTITVAYITT